VTDLRLDYRQATIETINLRLIRPEQGRRITRMARRPPRDDCRYKKFSADRKWASCVVGRYPPLEPISWSIFLFLLLLCPSTMGPARSPHMYTRCLLFLPTSSRLLKYSDGISYTSRRGGCSRASGWSRFPGRSGSGERLLSWVGPGDHDVQLIRRGSWRVPMRRHREAAPWSLKTSS